MKEAQRVTSTGSFRELSQENLERYVKLKIQKGNKKRSKTYIKLKIWRTN